MLFQCNSPRQDSQHQVEDKEGANDDERDEVHPVPCGTQGVVGLELTTSCMTIGPISSEYIRPLDCCAYVVKNSRPSFHGDALEDCEHGKQDVVKLRDAVIGPNPGVVAVVLLWTVPHAARESQL